MTTLKDTQPSTLLFVFALGAVITYVVSLFLPFPYSKTRKASPAYDSTSTVQMMENLGTSDQRFPEGSDSVQMMMDDMSASLSGKTGTDFDKVFLREMIIHHKGAVVMAEQALQHSTNKNVRALSTQIIETQSKEIKEMEAWLKEITVK